MHFQKRPLTETFLSRKRMELWMVVPVQLLTGESTPVAMLCCRILQCLHWKREWKAVNTVKLIFWMHSGFCKDALQGAHSNPETLQAVCGVPAARTQLCLLPTSLMGVQALCCKCIFRVSTSPCPGVPAGRRCGCTTGEPLPGPQFTCSHSARATELPGPLMQSLDLIIHTPSCRSGAQSWPLEIWKSHYVVYIDGDHSRMGILHSVIQQQFCTQAHYFEKQR